LKVIWTRLYKQQQQQQQQQRVRRESTKENGVRKSKVKHGTGALDLTTVVLVIHKSRIEHLITQSVLMTVIFAEQEVEIARYRTRAT
jgi:hypothetical protein